MPINDGIYSQTIGPSLRKKKTSSVKPIYVAIVLVIVAIASAWAVRAEAQTTDPAWASYRVRVSGGAGSSVGITPNIAVTNAHVVGGSKTARLIHQPTKREWSGQVVARDPSADVAFIYVASGDLDWVYLGSDPQPGQSCHLYGYGGDGILKRGNGHYTRIVGSRNPGVPSWGARVESVSGDSGSGIFDDAGRLCSINWSGNDRAESGSIPVTYVVRLFDRMNQPSQPQAPAQISSSGRVPRKQPVALQPKQPVAAAFEPDKLLEHLARAWK